MMLCASSALHGRAQHVAAWRHATLHGVWNCIAVNFVSTTQGHMIPSSHHWRRYGKLSAGGADHGLHSSRGSKRLHITSRRHLTMPTMATQDTVFDAACLEYDNHYSRRACLLTTSMRIAEQGSRCPDDPPDLAGYKRFNNIPDISIHVPSHGDTCRPSMALPNYPGFSGGTKYCQPLQGLSSFAGP
ncbi:hypothetical protein DE146DRAFT_62528 [Phaeosphaeria sp. MPI-PUGE-AT-0046c]|nr:hypothetical protein DE146DRAFT_62528 [Phaeosphaeria sp. MPI-PUGE-AT-0046c]